MGKTEIGTMAATIGHYINGAVVHGTGGRTSEVFNPATGEVSALVQLADGATVDRAVQAARAAFAAWTETSALNRARVMFRFKALLEEHHDALARLITREHGKVLSDARGEVQRGIEV